MAKITNQLQRPVYAAISRKDLPNAPKSEGGYEIIKINPGDSSPDDLDVDWVTQEEPTVVNQNNRAVLNIDKNAKGFKIPDRVFGNDPYTIRSAGNRQVTVDGGSLKTAGEMNGGYSMDDDSFDVKTYQAPPPQPSRFDKALNFLGSLFQ